MQDGQRTEMMRKRHQMTLWAPFAVIALGVFRSSAEVKLWTEAGLRPRFHPLQILGFEGVQAG